MVYPLESSDLIMNDITHTLLPAGFFDLLPPDAGRQRLLQQQIITAMESFGYAELRPPLMEFEHSLLGANGQDLSAQTFRLMDPISHEMLAIRADMTMQVARIARTRLCNEPKPLRLCYAGNCLRITGEGLRKKREIQQAGAELIGVKSANANHEIIKVAVSSLVCLDIGEITIDINLPDLANLFIAQVPAANQHKLREAIAHKDRSAISNMDIEFKYELLLLLEYGADDSLLEHWQQVIPKLPPEISSLFADWLKMASLIRKADIAARITFDPLEHKGFEYHSGFAFSIFATKIDCEIGRGGRYFLDSNTPATGFSLYLNPLLYHMPVTSNSKRCYVTIDNDEAQCAKMRADGWITIYATGEETIDMHDAAIQAGCNHILKQGKIIPINTND